MDNLIKEKSNLIKVVFVLAIVVSAYVAVLVFSEIKKDSMLGESSTPATISFSGHGEVQAVPDIASVYFTISKDSVTAVNAQTGVATVEKKALDFLKTKSIAEKDIKTENVSLYPKYDNPSPCPMVFGSPPCVRSEPKIVGYTASESITVKIRKTDDAGSIIQGLGTLGVSNLSGPNFSIDDTDVLKAQARKLAIDDAKAKAGVLAKDLGVTLSKIVNFSDSSGGYPIMYAQSAMMKDSVGTAPAPAVIPKGENTISSDVTITYEIK